MKKLFLLSVCALLVACADTARLGYERNIAVYYNTQPRDCQQIGMTVLSLSLWTGDLEKEINELREEAQRIGGNYVNIETYHYKAGIFSSSAYHMTGTIYHCPAKK